VIFSASKKVLARSYSNLCCASLNHFRSGIPAFGG
jgi:hypothetical protein